MDKIEFWQLIDAAKEKAADDQELQEQLLIDSLELYSTEHIIDFECILRQYLIEADDYKIIGAQKIIDGWVSDDPYLYFRCWLIGQGQEVFLNALRDADTLASVIDEPYSDFESLLYVATTAFERRTGKLEEDETFPREIASARGLEYDFGTVTKGEDWTEDQLPMLFPKLYAKFNN